MAPLEIADVLKAKESYRSFPWKLVSYYYVFILYRHGIINMFAWTSWQQDSVVSASHVWISEEQMI